MLRLLPALLIACATPPTGGGATATSSLSTDTAADTGAPTTPTTPTTSTFVQDPGCVGAGPECVALETLPPLWEVTNPPPAGPSGVGRLGDVSGDGITDWSVITWDGTQLISYVVHGPLRPLSVTADASASLTGGVISGEIGDVDQDGLSDLAWSDPYSGDRVLLAPFEGELSARPADLALSTLDRLTLGGDRLDLITLHERSVTNYDFTLTPGPLSNFTAGVGATLFDVQLVNVEPDVCDWTVLTPRISAIGDLDSDGVGERVLYPFGDSDSSCMYYVGYLMPDELPAQVVLDPEGIEDWLVVGYPLAIPDQDGDGVNDAVIDGHLLAGPVTRVGDALVGVKDYGPVDFSPWLPPTPVVDVTGDGIQDWLVVSGTAYGDGTVRDVYLRAGGVDALLAPPVNLRWWSGKYADEFEVEGDTVLFPSWNGVVAVDLLP